MTGKILLLCTCVVALTATGCASNNSRFQWGNYEGALYAYSKKPDAREKYQSALEVAISKGEERSAIAPGLYAELGYLYLESGDAARATELFEREMEAFPESKVFLTTIIERLHGAAPGGLEEPAPSADDAAEDIASAPGV